MAARLLPPLQTKTKPCSLYFPNQKKTDGWNDELELTWRGSHYHSTN